MDALLKLNEFHGGVYFEAIAKGVKFSQYVGIIQVDGVTIEINPKADKRDDRNNWKGVLIKMLQKCGRLKPSTAGAANVNKQNLNLLEIYFEQYMNELESLIRKGLVKQYRRNTSNVKALKGKLEFAGNIQKNVIHKERFYTSHQVYDKNHLLHQILYYALDIVEQFTRGTRLYDQCRRTMLNFPKVDLKRVTAEQIDQVELNRKSKGYEDALQLARLIILNFSPDISYGKERMISILFDMNVLWEEYVYVMLRNECKKHGISIKGQSKKKFWGRNSLKPDIVLEKNDVKYVIDTKWKIPHSNSASVSDLRQMYTYSRFWKADRAMLLYPGSIKSSDFRKFETFEFAPGENEYQHECKMGFVSVLNTKNELDESLSVKVLSELGLSIKDNEEKLDKVSDR